MVEVYFIMCDFGIGVKESRKKLLTSQYIILQKFKYKYLY